MDAANPLLSQKEYLKRYLSKDKNPKKKKKLKISSSSHLKRSVIIDDDLGLKDVANVDDEEFNLDYLGDEAPQIVGIVDERPTEIKAKEKYANKLWRSLDEAGQEDTSLGNSDNISEVDGKKRQSNANKRGESDSDLSPPRPTDSSIDLIETRHKEGDTHNKSKSKKAHSSRTDQYRERKYDYKKEDHSDSDLSPSRTSTKSRKDRICSRDYKNSEDQYLSRSKSYSRESLERRDRLTKKSYGHKQRIREDKKVNRKYSNNKSNSSDDDGVDYRRRSHEKTKDRGRSTYPSKYSDRKYDEQKSPKRKESKYRGKGSDSDLSPERNNPDSRRKRNKVHASAEILEKTLEKKKSGLQNAKQLKEELKKLKENEDKVFKMMDPTLMGKTAAPIKRDRKTGQIRNLEKEREAEKVKAEKRAQTENKYYKWGKGLKQVQEQEDRIADAIHEMSKPLARYRDDKDLDAFLRAQEREGDPMLDYIRNKQTESHNVIDITVGSSKPKYNGSFMPNRFGIKPGYRWDGVDRSNGYEKKWFEQRNARKAVEEEAYKWSTSDM